MLKIISGAQTGVDRGALDAALAAGVECGGWCPAGRLAEDGRIPDRYPLVELPAGGYAERTARNVADSDGTLIITFGEPQGGTRETIGCCIEQQRRHAVIDASHTRVNKAAAIADAFISGNGIRVLNVAGARASEAPEAYHYAVCLIRSVLQRTSR